MAFSRLGVTALQAWLGYKTIHSLKYSAGVHKAMVRGALVG